MMSIRLLQLQQILLAVEAVGEACQGAVAADYAVAGDNEGYGVAADGTTDGLRGAATDASGNLAISHRLPIGYSEEFMPDTLLESCAAKVYRRGEVGSVTGKVEVEPTYTSS